MNNTNMTARKNDMIIRVLFIIILFVSLSRIIYNFSFLKDSFHSDEVWSFGLSNSYYEPFIYQSADHTQLINKDQWLSSDVMKDYLTVNKDQRFEYGSVIYNQNNDYHPPLYYFILHTICSFFPGKISAWYGFVINIAAYTAVFYFLYKLVNEITGTKIYGLICCAFYGFSSGALNTFVFIRMYAPLTAIATASLYFHSRLYHTKNIKKYTVPLFLLTLSGALTHHFYLPFAGVISFCFCCYYLIRKNFRTLTVYALSMLGSAGLSVILFPATIDHLFSGRINETKYTMSWQIILTFNCMFRELFGFEFSVVPRISYTALLIEICCVIVIISPVFFLLRNTRFLRNSVQSIKRIIFTSFRKLKKADLMILTMLVASLSVLLLTSFTVSHITMSVSTNRYIFLIYPAVCAFLISLLSYFLKWTVKNKKIAFSLVTGVCCIFCISSNINSDVLYLFSKPDDVVSIKELITDSNCVFITSDYWTLTCFTWESTEAEFIYATTDDDLVSKITNMPDPPDTERTMYYIVENGAFQLELKESEVFEGMMPPKGISSKNSHKLKKEEFISLMNEVYSECDYIGHDYIFDREYSIYSVKKSR